MTTPVKRTGMIGLGAMGLQMARHMAKKGFEVSGFDISSEVVNKAKANGIATLGSSAEVGQRSEVVMIMVATGEQVEEVITGSLLGKLAPGSVICIASSVSPELCQRMDKLAAEKGCGVAKTDRAEQALMKLLAQRREQRAAAQFTGVKTRFGL